MRSLLDEVLEAHGGLERWRAARTVRVRVRSGGLLVRTRVPGNRFADYRLTVEVQEPRAVVDPFPRTGQRGVFDRGQARIEGEEGEVLASRADRAPRSSAARDCAATCAGTRSTPPTSVATRCGTT